MTCSRAPSRAWGLTIQTNRSLDKSARVDKTARMGILAEGNNYIQIVIIAAAFFVVIFAVLAFAILGKYLRLWVQSVSRSAGIGIFDLLGMTFRKVDPKAIVRSKFMAAPSRSRGRSSTSTNSLGAHY